jgi:UDP-N-acetylmuramyl pentapeptide synthase
MNFSALEGGQPQLAILGDMLELGTSSLAEHEAIVALLRSLDLDAWLVGPEFSKAARNTPSCGSRTLMMRWPSRKVDPSPDR